jgi:hypothetical protein
VQHSLYLTLLLTVGALVGACSDSSVPPTEVSTKIAPETPPDPDTDIHSTTPDAGDSAEPATAMHFRCDDGSHFSLSLDGPSGLMTRDDTLHELRQEPAASGMFYSGDQWQVHSKDNRALLIGPDSTRQCQRVDEETHSHARNITDIL